MKEFSSLLAVLGLALVLAPAAARAQSGEDDPLSTEAALTGGAVLASDDPGGSGWYNPAALGGIERSSLQVVASAYGLERVTLEGALVTKLPWTTHQGVSKDWDFTSVPSVLAYSLKLRNGLGLSAGLWTPAHTSYTATIADASSGVDPSQPGIQSYQQSYNWTEKYDDTWAGLSVGWEAMPGLRLGASLQGSYTTNSIVVDLASTMQSDQGDPRQSGGHLSINIRTDQTVIATRALIGLQWVVSPSLRLALVLRSPSLRLIQRAHVSRSTTLAILQAGAAPVEASSIEAHDPRGDPDVMSAGRVFAGVSWQEGRWGFRLEGDWAPALKADLLSTIASWDVRVGVLFDVDKDMRVGLGGFRNGAQNQASEGRLSLDVFGFSGGFDTRPAKVVKALGGDDGSWDLRSGLAARLFWGSGSGPGMSLVPFDPAQSVLPIFPGEGDKPFLATAASSFGGTLYFFTTLKF